MAEFRTGEYRFVLVVGDYNDVYCKVAIKYIFFWICAHYNQSQSCNEFNQAVLGISTQAPYMLMNECVRQFVCSGEWTCHILGHEPNQRRNPKPATESRFFGAESRQKCHKGSKTHHKTYRILSLHGCLCVFMSHLPKYIVGDSIFVGSDNIWSSSKTAGKERTDLA